MVFVKPGKSKNEAIQTGADTILGSDEKINLQKWQIEKTERYLTEHYDLRNNIVSNEIEISPKDQNQWAGVNENDLWREFQHKNIPFSKQKTIDLLKSSFVQPHDPILEYFNTLKKWDGKTDHIKELASYVATKDGFANWLRHFKKHLVRTVHCAIDDKYFNKQVLIMVHDQQNSGKSSFCRWLCPPALSNYFTENLTLDKDGHIALTENFIINLDELESMSRMEINALKSIISKQQVKIRKPYEKKATTSMRRCSFVGSTNDTEFLVDSTGNVRFVCIEIESINFDYSKNVDINKVWAQALALLNSGFDHQLDEEEIKRNEIINERFRLVSVEEDLIKRNFKAALKTDPQAKFITPAGIVEDLQKNTDSAHRLNTRAVGRAMRKLGFPQDTFHNGQYTIRGYYVTELNSIRP